MLSCEETSRLVSESLDRQLPLRQRIAVRMHLLMCKACARARQQLLFMRKAILRLEDDIEKAVSSSSLSPQARDRIKNLMRLSTDDAAPDEM